jgi:hypothetical protein
LKNEETVFWALVAIVNSYLEEYFSRSLIGSLVDIKVHFHNRSHYYLQNIDIFFFRCLRFFSLPLSPSCTLTSNKSDFLWTQSPPNGSCVCSLKRECQQRHSCEFGTHSSSTVLMRSYTPSSSLSLLPSHHLFTAHLHRTHSLPSI